MGGGFSSSNSKYFDCTDGREDNIDCIICNNKIIDYHCCKCKRCKSLSHIICQSKIEIKNKCIGCNNSLIIYSHYRENNN
jgi:hypothetical protein